MRQVNSGTRPLCLTRQPLLKEVFLQHESGFSQLLGRAVWEEDSNAVDLQRNYVLREVQLQVGDREF